jgi:hypothetical protein
LAAEPIAMRNLYLQRLTRLSYLTILWLLLLLPALSHAQTTNISGVVNSYYSVLAVDAVRDGVKLNTVAGLAPQDKVLLIQMKGATINTANGSTPGYGDTTSLNNAGNYEIHTVCAIRNDSAFFVNDVLNNYTIADKVQLVKFGTYVNANVNGVLTANTWNNATGTGGVIAIFVEQDLTLNNIITADSRGFAGGAGVLSGSTCLNTHNQNFYNANAVSPATQNGAFKGEGIVDRPAAESGGKAAPANGGGGGNDHNNSGGGGSNLVRGGVGGGNSGNSSCKTAYISEGGKALSSWGGKKIFLGGGGGAGHKNNVTSLSQGGAGGGLIFIHAANVIGNGFLITTSGGAGGDSQSDGAGGGGGGGTVIMDVPNYTGSLTILAEGGAGGISDDGLNNKLCFGGGGGGSGGVIYFSGATPPVSISANGGALGIEFNRWDATCPAAPVVSGPGLTGVIIPNYTFRASSTLAATCTAILPVRLGYFNANTEGKKVILQWQVFNPEDASTFVVERMDKYGNWISLQTIQANNSQTEYQSVDNFPDAGYNNYRIRVNEKNNTLLYTAVRRVFVGVTIESFSIFPNPARDRITLRGNFDATATIRLIDVSGKIILNSRTGSANTAELKLPALSPGIYMLHINNGVEKLIIR